MTKTKPTPSEFKRSWRLFNSKMQDKKRVRQLNKLLGIEAFKAPPKE